MKAVQGVALAIALASPALAAPGAGREARKPFVFGGVSWISQQAFIESGRRCGTVQPDAEAIEEIDRQVADYILARGPEAAATGGTINVYFHVINRGAGLANGDVPDSQINDLHRQPAAACSAGRPSLRATRAIPGTTVSWSCSRRCPAAAPRPTTRATPAPTRSATGWGCSTRSRAAAAG